MLDLCPKWLSQVSISILAQAYLHRAGGAPSPRHDFAAISLTRFDWFAATERSLAQDTPAICGTTAKKKRARLTAHRSQAHCFYRQPAAEERRRSRDRAGSRRHEAAKGLSAARQHFCETGPLGSIDTRRLWRRTEQLWRCAWHRTHCRMSFLG